MSLFDGEKRSTNVVAKTDCNLFEIRSSNFFDIIKKSPNVSLEIIKKLSSRLRRANNKIENISNHNSEYRIGVSIIDLAEDFGEIFHGDIKIKNSQHKLKLAI